MYVRPLGRELKLRTFKQRPLMWLPTLIVIRPSRQEVATGKVKLIG